MLFLAIFYLKKTLLLYRGGLFMSNDNMQSSTIANMAINTAFTAPFIAPDIVRLVKYRNDVTPAFKTFNEKLIKAGKKDIFERSNIVLKNYEAYNKAAKISFGEHIKNIGRKIMGKEIVKPDADELKRMRENLKKGKEIVQITTKAGFLNNFKSMFTSSIKDKFSIGLTALFAIPEFIEKVIPKFKEEGISSGLKATGKWAVKTAADFFSFTLGNTVGTIIGSILIPIPGVGAALGKTIFGMAGASFFGKANGKVVNRILGEDEKETSENKEENEQTIQLNQIPQNSNGGKFVMDM